MVLKEIAIMLGNYPWRSMGIINGNGRWGGLQIRQNCELWEKPLAVLKEEEKTAGSSNK